MLMARRQFSGGNAREMSSSSVFGHGKWVAGGWWVVGGRSAFYVTRLSSTYTPNG